MIYKSKLKKGTVQNICAELVRDFAVIRRQNPTQQEYIICEKLWSFWYVQNKERIWKDGSDLLCERLEELRLERNKPLLDDEIYKVYSDFLLIETGINIGEYKLYAKAIKLLYKQMKKAGLHTQSSKKEVLKEIKFLHKLYKKEK